MPYITTEIACPSCSTLMHETDEGAALIILECTSCGLKCRAKKEGAE